MSRGNTSASLFEAKPVYCIWMELWWPLWQWNMCISSVVLFYDTMMCVTCDILSILSPVHKTVRNPGLSNAFRCSTVDKDVNDAIYILRREKASTDLFYTVNLGLLVERIETSLLFSCPERISSKWWWTLQKISIYKKLYVISENGMKYGIKWLRQWGIVIILGRSSFWHYSWKTL